MSRTATNVTVGTVAVSAPAQKSVREIRHPFRLRLGRGHSGVSRGRRVKLVAEFTANLSGTDVTKVTQVISVELVPPSIAAPQPAIAPPAVR